MHLECGWVGCKGLLDLNTVLGGKTWISGLKLLELGEPANLPHMPLQASDGSGSKIFDPVWSGSATSGFGNFPLKIPNFSIFLSSGPKKFQNLGQ